MAFFKSVLIVGVMLLTPGCVHAQRATSVFSVAQPAAPTTGRAFLIEAAGATAGSLIGFGLVYLTEDNCESEDLSCYLEKAGLGLLTSAIGATVGTYIVGNLADTEPSTLGAALGAIAGAAAGVGTRHLLKEDLNVASSAAAGMLTYSITQGVLTAAGSRIASALK